MKLRTIIAIISISIFGISANAQHLSSTRNFKAIGLGLGLPYGALGAKFSYNPISQTTLFLGLGYNLVEVGFNVGVYRSFPSDVQTQFYIIGMYGSNASVKVEGSDELSKSYYGPTFGAGIKINSVRREGNHWDIGILVPIRTSEFNDDIDYLQDLGYDLTEPWPILFTVGYNFSLGN